MTKSINLVTEVPGPKSRELEAMKNQYVPRAMSIHAPVYVERAEGALLEDVDGNTFIDLAGGVGVMNVGHSQPEIVEAIKEHVERFTHTDFTVVPYDSYVKLAERLAKLLPGDTPKKVAFFNSGAEAVENAVKIAKAYTKKSGIITFENAFHGRTMMAMTLTSKVKPYKQGFGPFASNVYRIPYAYCYRCPLNLEYPSCDIKCADELKEAFLHTVAPEDTAAVIVEPVQGEGGFIVPPKEYLKRLQEIAHENNVLLIVDEVQTGFARTGYMFASEYSDIEPDIIVLAKSIAAGMPLSGVAGKAHVMDGPGDSGIGGTYVGNPVACTASLKVIDLIEREQLVDRSKELGKRAYDRFKAMQEKYDIIGDVRGLGSMVGIELVKDRQTKEPAAQETNRILKKAFEKGVISLKAGIYGNVIRVLSPLTITEEQLDEALDVIEEAIKEVLNEK